MKKHTQQNGETKKKRFIDTLDIHEMDSNIHNIDNFFGTIRKVTLTSSIVVYINRSL